jgi:hypothetical protein
MRRWKHNLHDVPIDKGDYDKLRFWDYSVLLSYIIRSKHLLLCNNQRQMCFYIVYEI